MPDDSHVRTHSGRGRENKPVRPSVDYGGLGALRAGEAAPRRARLRRPPPSLRERAREGPRLRRIGPLALPPCLRRRVPGREPRAGTAPRSLARRERRSLRRRRSRPGDLLLERERPAGAARLPPATSGLPRGPAGHELPLDRRCSRRRLVGVAGSAARSARGGARGAKPRPCSLVSGRPRSAGRPPSVVCYETDGDEARGVVSALRRARVPGGSWSSLAVLARTNAQLVLFERELDLAGIPFRSGGGRGVPVPARCSHRPRALDPWGGWGFGASSSYLARRAAAVGPAAADMRRGGGGEAAARVPATTTSPSSRASRIDYLRGDSSPSPAGLVGWLEASLRSDPPRQAGDAVDLVTFHRAKGLEWRASS